MLETETTKPLTAPQRRMLDEVIAAGSRSYNGRAAKTVKALEDAGYVTVTRDAIPQSKGGGIELVQRLTVAVSEQFDEAMMDGRWP